jgi:ATP-binding cassette, subfamily B, bacterial
MRLASSKFGAWWRSETEGLAAARFAFPHAWRACRWALIAVVALVGLQGLSVAYSAVLVAQTITLITTPDQAVLSPLWLGATWVLLVVIEFMLSPVLFWATGVLNERMTARIHTEMITKSLTIEDLALFDNADLHDEVSILADEASSRPVNIVILFSSILRSTVAVVSVAGILASIAWWLPPAMLALSIPLARSIIRLRSLTHQALLNRTRESRYLDYLARLPLSAHAAKELRLFRFGPRILDTYDRTFHRLHTKSQRVRTRETSRAMPGITLSCLGYLTCLWWLVQAGITGRLPVAMAVLGLQLVMGMQATLSSLVETFGFVGERALFYAKFNNFLRRPPALRDGHREIPRFESLEFRDVHFTYPGNSAPTLCGLSFHITAGQKLAIVGENGAGKSTLFKLIARFYDPNQGRILVNGIPLNELRIASWRRLISAVFQDYAHYNFSLVDNVTLSDLHANGSLPSEELHTVGLDPSMHGLPELDDMLGRDFGGTELSTGQWQRIAIARGAYRKHDLLLLDEPTSSLDPNAEEHVLQSFLHISTGKTVLFITHRLAAVYLFDEILHIANGRLHATGTHQHLLKTNTLYSQMITNQAKHYKNLDQESLGGNPGNPAAAR